MRNIGTAVLAAALATTGIITAPAQAQGAAPGLKIQKVTRTTLDSGTCALEVHFKDQTPGSVDGNDFYGLSVTPTVSWDGQAFPDHFLLYPCKAFKKGTTYTFVVREWDDNGKRQKVVATSPGFTWKR